ncbi:MAG: DUF4388 domain-containing protein [Planctomycetota bacterium]|jgi:tetratricopeptide (TPR) repeat protein
MALRGSLETLPLTSVFQFVAGRTGTGSVWVFDGMQEKYIYFEDGNIRFLATGNEENYRLGAYLMKFIVQSPEVVYSCLEEAYSLGKRPETALIEADLATKEHLNAAARIWVEEQLFELARLRSGEFNFMPDYYPRSRIDRLLEGCDISIPINDFLFEFLKRSREWELLEENIPDETVIFEATDFEPEDLGTCMLPPTWLNETRLIDGTRSISDIVAETMLTKFELYKFISELKNRGLVVIADKDRLLANAEEALKKKDMVAAIRYFDNALAAAKGDISVRVRYAEVLKETNNAERAFEQFCTIGDHYMNEEKLDEAMKYYVEAEKIMPHSIFIRSLIADLHEQMGEPKKALELRAEMAYILMNKKHFRDAADIFIYLSEIDPEGIQWCLEAAEAFGRLDMPENAVEFYEKAIALASAENSSTDVQVIQEHVRNNFPGNRKLEDKVHKTTRMFGECFRRRINS